jgi:hypothetical protein
MIVLVGKANVPPTPLTIRRSTIAISLVIGSGISDRNGVTKKTNGKIRKAIRRQRTTPR